MGKLFCSDKGPDLYQNCPLSPNMTSGCGCQPVNTLMVFPNMHHCCVKSKKKIFPALHIAAPGTWEPHEFPSHPSIGEGWDDNEAFFLSFSSDKGGKAISPRPLPPSRKESNITSYNMCITLCTSYNGWNTFNDLFTHNAKFDLRS